MTSPRSPMGHWIFEEYKMSERSLGFSRFSSQSTSSYSSIRVISGWRHSLVHSIRRRLALGFSFASSLLASSCGCFSGLSSHSQSVC